MSILVVGTVAFDSIETPFGKAEQILGGSATYISLAARFFTEPVRLVGVVGKDFPDRFVQLFQHHRIDLDGLVQDPEGKTFAWEGRYHFDLNVRDTLATHLNVLRTFEPVVPEQYRDSRIVCLGNLDPTIQSRVLDQVDSPDLVVCDTMNFWIENMPDELRETLKRVDVLVINESEARELAEDPNLIRAARKIRGMGPEAVIIKKGEHGALMFVNDTIFSAPAFPLEDIHDPTGAGDTFAGGLVGFLNTCEDFDMESFKKGIIYGSALASFCVEKFGPDRLTELTLEEVTERAQAFHALSAIPQFTFPAVQDVRV